MRASLRLVGVIGQEWYGTGRCFFSNGNYFYGEVDHDMLHGFGTMIYANGDKVLLGGCGEGGGDGNGRRGGEGLMSLTLLCSLWGLLWTICEKARECTRHPAAMCTKESS